MNRLFKKKRNLTTKALEKILGEFSVIVGKDALQGKTGGYFIVKKYITMSGGVFRPIIPVGKIPVDKDEKYSFLAREKAERLSKDISDTDHLTSYESRDPAFIFPENHQLWGKWGGAVLVNMFTIYSFSGFPELVDEAFVCWVALKRRKMTKEYFMELCKRRDDNPYLRVILKHIK